MEENERDSERRDKVVNCQFYGLVGEKEHKLRAGEKISSGKKRDVMADGV